MVISLEPIRYTPAGIPLLSFMLQHASEQFEAGLKRKVECEVNAVVLGNITGDIAKQNIQLEKIKLGSSVNVKGFLAKRSAKSTQLVLHIEKLELI